MCRSTGTAECDAVVARICSSRGGLSPASGLLGAVSACTQAFSVFCFFFFGASSPEEVDSDSEVEDESASAFFFDFLFLFVFSANLPFFLSSFL